MHVCMHLHNTAYAYKHTYRLCGSGTQVAAKQWQGTVSMWRGATSCGKLPRSKALSRGAYTYIDMKIVMLSSRLFGFELESHKLHVFCGACPPVGCSVRLSAVPYACSGKCCKHLPYSFVCRAQCMQTHHHFAVHSKFSCSGPTTSWWEGRCPCASRTSPLSSITSVHCCQVCIPVLPDPPLICFIPDSSFAFCMRLDHHVYISHQ
jgi:hypothetical protein